MLQDVIAERHGENSQFIGRSLRGGVMLSSVGSAIVFAHQREVGNCDLRMRRTLLFGRFSSS